jgi:hypothetical protein
MRLGTFLCLSRTYEKQRFSHYVQGKSQETFLKVEFEILHEPGDGPPASLVPAGSKDGVPR